MGYGLVIAGMIWNRGICAVAVVVAGTHISHIDIIAINC
jgi:hypothetical protein